jgi:hypothetical protein
LDGPWKRAAPEENIQCQVDVYSTRLDLAKEHKQLHNATPIDEFNLGDLLSVPEPEERAD